ncbi:MAG: hypothetical protein ACYDBT_05025 [Desulfobulbaceae bacterium]
MTNICLGDLVEFENQERKRLNRRLTQLAAKKERFKILPDDEEQELDFLSDIRPIVKNFIRLEETTEKDNERVNALFIGVRDLFNSSSEHNVKLLSTHLSNFTPKGLLEELPFEDLVKVALVVGFLSAEGVPAPGLAVEGKNIRSKRGDKNYPAFVEAFYGAVGASERSFPLAVKVLPLLAREGDPDPNGKNGTVKCREFAGVVRCLEGRGVRYNEPQLRRYINQCLNKIQNVTGEDRIDEVGISIPDFMSQADYQIKPDNVMLMGPILCAKMFEDLKVFQVLDKLVELSQNGMLTIGEGEAGRMLYLYWKNTPNRISESERRNIYSSTLGVPGGDGGGSPNREFNDLWLRFISAVSSLVRQRTADQILRTNMPASIGQQQVRKAARDLAMNLSARGYGMTYYLAKDLNAQITDIIKILSDQEIRACFGASNMWQVIDQVATLELGGALNSARCSSMASSGAIVIAWLATNVNRYNKVTSAAVINVDEVVSIEPPTSGEPTRSPTDYDLVNACELWLADTATSDVRIEEMAQPREAPMMTSRPVQIPSIAREMLETAGVGVPGFGLGAGMTRRL